MNKFSEISLKLSQICLKIYTNVKILTYRKFKISGVNFVQQKLVCFNFFFRLGSTTKDEREPIHGLLKLPFFWGGGVPI